MLYSVLLICLLYTHFEVGETLKSDELEKYDDHKPVLVANQKSSESDTNSNPKNPKQNMMPLKIDQPMKAIDGETSNIYSTEQFSTSSEKKVDKDIISKPISKLRASSELQIPVVVVYENSNTAKTNIKSKTDNATESPKKGRFLRRRPNKDNSLTENVLKETANRPENLKTMTNPPTKTFPKRLSGRDPVVPILSSENYVYSHTGDFHYRYEGGDGTIAYSEGSLKKGDKSAGEAVKGGFSYTDKDGNDFSLSYTADENGYRPVGAHLPTPPPIPPAIARALEYLATATPQPVTQRASNLDTTLNK